MVDDGSRSDYSSIHDLFFTPLKAEEESRLGDDSSVILIMINGNVPSFKELLSISKKAYSVDAFFFQIQSITKLLQGM